jgi:serine/threonine protein kinase
MSHTGNKSLYGYTPTYAPLEQMRNDGTDARSDIYALGATLYHLLTGTAPADALLRVNAIIGGEIDPLRALCEANPDVPPDVARILHQTLALHKGQRPADTLMLRQMLRNARRNANNGAPPPPTLLMPTGNAVRVTAPSDEETVLDVLPAQLSPANAGKGTAANQGATLASRTQLPEQRAKRPATRVAAPAAEAAAAPQSKQLHYGVAALLAALLLGVAAWAFTGRGPAATDSAQNGVPATQPQFEVSSPMVTAWPAATPDAAATPAASPAAQLLDANGQPVPAPSATPDAVSNNENTTLAQPGNTPPVQPAPYPQTPQQPIQQAPPAQTQPTQAPIIAQQTQSAPPPVNQPPSNAPPPLQQRDNRPLKPNYPPPQPPWQPLPVGIVPRPGQGPMGPPPGPRRP